MTVLQQTALNYLEIADKLELAASHCRIAAKHYQHNDVPRGHAHAFATLGFLKDSEENLIENAKTAAKFSKT